MATNTEKIVVQVVVQGQKGLDKVGKSADKGTKSFGKMAAGVAAAAAAFATINKVIGSSIKSFRNFEFQMAKVKAITGASREEFLRLSKTAQDLGRSTFFTAQQVAELQTNFGKLGFSTKEILQAQEATLLLATATDTDLARAAIVAGASIRGFGLDAGQTTRVTDVMAKAFTSSALDIEKFQTSMTKVAPIAAGANISLEATTAVMGTLTDAGIEASIAGTSLRNIFLQMQDPSSKLAKNLGFTVKSSDDLQRAMEKLKGESDETLTSLVKVRQVAAFKVMVKGADRIADLTEELNNSSGAAKIMADIVGDTLEGAMKRSESATDGFSIALVDRMGEGLKNLIDGFASFVGKLTDFMEIPISEKLQKDKFEMDALFEVIKDTNIAQETRNRAITTLNTKYGEYLPKLITEKDNVRQLSEHQKNANLQMAEKIRMMGAEERLLKIQKEGQEVQGEIFDLELRIKENKDKIKRGEAEIQQGKYTTINVTQGQIDADERRVLKLNEEADAYTKKYEDALVVAEQFGVQLKDNQKVEEDSSAGSGTGGDGGSVVVNEMKDRNQALLKLQLEYAEELTDTEGKSLEEREVHLKALETFYNEDKLQVQLDFINAKLANTITSEEEKIALQQQYAQLELTEEQRIQGVKLQNMRDERDAFVGLQDAKAAAVRGYLNIAAGFAEEGSDLAKAIFLIQQAMAVKDVIVTNLRTNAQITAEGLALSIPTFGASVATAAALVSANNITSSLSIAGIVAQTVAGISKKARGGMIEEFANGGMVHGKSHAQGGEKFAVGGRVVELEGGEAVINKRSTAMFSRQLSAMNAAGGGVKFADGGLLNMPSFNQQQFNAIGQNQMLGAMGSSGKVVVVESDITDSQNSVSVIQSEATI